MLSVPAIGCAGWQEAGGRPLAPNPGPGDHDSPGGNALTNLNSAGWQFKFVLEVTVTENGMQCCAATILNLNFKVEGQPESAVRLGVWHTRPRVGAGGLSD